MVMNEKMHIQYIQQNQMKHKQSNKLTIQYHQLLLLIQLLKLFINLTATKKT